MNAKLEQLIGRLQEIARKNDDEFSYNVEIVPTRAIGFTFNFLCVETADSHIFVGGSGPDLEIAVEAAGKTVTRACREWGYEV